MEELVDFYDYIKALFPMQPYDYEYDHVKEAIRQFYRKGMTHSFCAVPDVRSNTDIVQGDVLSCLRFSYYDEDANERFIKAPAMIISNSCDIENDGHILLAPAIPLRDIESVDRSLLETIKNNQKTNFLYIPDNGILKNYVIDFSWISMFPKNVIVGLLNQKKSEKIITLNQLGYYMLLCKLAVHFMRPESVEVQRLAN